MNISEANVKRLTEMSKRIRLNGLKMALQSGNNGSHLGGSLSCVEIMAVLYGEILRVDPKDPLNTERDIFIPSKNHCVLSHIPALVETGFITEEEMLEFQKDGGRLTGYPRRLAIGLEYSGGSLGMAISVGVGLALSARERNSDKQIYILLGDGELHEGSVWEGFMSAAHYHLDNLTAIIDRNHLSYDGDTEKVMGIESLSQKMLAFNWHVSKCAGHSTHSLLKAFADKVEGKPHVIIADTIKGKGVSFIENKPEWHHHRLSQKEYELAVEEVMNAGGNL